MTETRLVILYGSQTGTAQDIAERIWREAKRYGFRGPVQPMDEYPVNELIHERLVVLVCSTTGQGEEPDNMKHFWKFLLRKNLPANSLQALSYAVLGLGDSSYVEYNYASKKLFRRLNSLGATALLPLGLADDQHDLGSDAATEPWIESLWNRLVSEWSPRSPLCDAPTPTGTFIYIEPRWKVSLSDTKDKNPPDCSDPWLTASAGDKQIAQVIVKSNVRTTTEHHFQDVRLMKLAGVPEHLTYSPGDTVSVRPQNSVSNVEELLGLLAGENGTRQAGSLKDSVLFIVEQSDPFMPVPKELSKPLTLRQLATAYWDLSAIPRRSALQVLAQITPNELEREKLMEFLDPQGQEERFNYIDRPRRTILELLSDFPHATAHLPHTLLFELLSPIKPRQFSIASSYKAHHGEVHILVAVVRYFTKLKAPRLGLCSNWLSNLCPGTRVPVWFRKGSFSFPKDENVPIIMVGPGTGVAPFRSLVHERTALGSAKDELLALFFGCRGAKSDFHCEDEWRQFQQNKQLSLFCAFSRDQPDKIYVQHVIKSHAEEVWKFLSSGAYIFVAGNSKNMPQSVREAFCDVVSQCANLTASAVEDFVANMERKRMYQTETWS